jgi:hypothetical protein
VNESFDQNLANLTNDSNFVPNTSSSFDEKNRDSDIAKSTFSDISNTLISGVKIGYDKAKCIISAIIYEDEEENGEYIEPSQIKRSKTFNFEKF